MEGRGRREEKDRREEGEGNREGSYCCRHRRTADRTVNAADQRSRFKVVPLLGKDAFVDLINKNKHDWKGRERQKQGEASQRLQHTNAGLLLLLAVIDEQQDQRDDQDARSTNDCSYLDLSDLVLVCC